jgi:hypothetical protein
MSSHDRSHDGIPKRSSRSKSKSINGDYYLIDNYFLILKIIFILFYKLHKQITNHDYWNQHTIEFQKEIWGQRVIMMILVITEVF